MLNYDVLQYIFRYLELPDILHFMMTAKKYWSLPRFKIFRRDFIICSKWKAYMLLSQKIPDIIYANSSPQLLKFIGWRPKPNYLEKKMLLK
jgi:hypothetical protein